MPVFTVPFDYDESTHPGVIPICIPDRDSDGRPVHSGWIEHGVAPAADRLIRIADRLLSDKYRASEIAEYAVHSLSRVHGDNIGEHPDYRVLNRAKWHAIDLRVGGRRARRMLDVELFAETLDQIEDQYDFVAALEKNEMVDKIVAQLDVLGLDRVHEMVPWMLRDAVGQVLTNEFGQKRNTLTTRFYRGMRKAARAAGVSWD